ncbi:MAG: hypothetical protein AABZ05_02125, partial [Nitrospirota bacterium]
DRTGDARRVHAKMPGNLLGRETKLFPASIGDLCTGLAHLPPFAPALYLAMLTLCLLHSSLMILLMVFRSAAA